MTEIQFKFYDPLVYKVKDTSALNKDLVRAFKTNDRVKIQETISNGVSNTVDVFITVNEHFDACILIVFVNNNSIFKHVQPVSGDPFKYRITCFVGESINVSKKSN